VIAGSIAALTFAFSLGNVAMLCVALGITAPLVSLLRRRSR
jgi:hypothetical protein